MILHSTRIFSKTTISRYFNNPDSLTPENQQIISDALDKLNYKENKVAKILANGQTEFVGVLIPSLSMNYYSEMLNQILASYEKYGYKFLVFAGNGHDETEHRYIQELMSYKIEGPHRPLPYTLLPRTLRSADPGRCN